MVRLSYMPQPYAGVRVTVLGASGFIGRWVSRALCAQGAQLCLVVRDARAAAAVFAQFEIEGDIVELDLVNLEAVSATLGRLRSSITFNMAGYGVDHAEQDELLAVRINGQLVGALCEALADLRDPRWPGQDLVHVGSALEYGALTGDLNEAAIPRPTTMYGRSKLAGSTELVNCCQARGLRGLVARLFTVYGPGEHATRLLPSLQAAAVTGNSLRMSAGEQLRDFTYVEDVADGLLRLGVASARPGEIVNLATGQLTRVRTFAETAAQILGVAGDRLEFGTIPPRFVEMEHSNVSLERLRQLTGWAPCTSIQEGVRRTQEFNRRVSWAGR